MTAATISEVKNVATQSFTLQLRDTLEWARLNNLRFDLWVRSTTQLSGPLRPQIELGSITLKRSRVP